MRIRFNYDKKVIVNGFLERAKIERDLKSLDQKATNAIMSQVFYKYASSTNPVIDSHSIILTLNEWCWYWILLDSTLILLLVGIAFVQNEDYHIKKAFVVSNERNVTQNGKITYIPIYYIMFFNADWGNKNLQF